MKKMQSQTQPQDDMTPEYDFSGGVRGKYAQALQEQGYLIRIYHADGMYTERRVFGEKTVLLDADVWEYFPDAESVNRALRALIALIPDKSAKRHVTRQTA